MDDGVAGGSKEDAKRMMGSLINGEYNGTIPKILAKCGMKVKFMAMSGDPNPETAEPLGGKVLGLPYDLKEDKIIFKTKSNAPSTGPGIIKKCFSLQPKDLEDIRDGRRKLTRREVLSFLMGCFDPLGLVAPVLIHGKILLR